MGKAEDAKTPPNQPQRPIYPPKKTIPPPPKRFLAVALVALTALTLSVGCASRRQIDEDATNSFKIEGTSWYGFCQGRNAFIWVPSRNDSDPDELEAVIYDDYRCVGNVQPSGSAKPGADPDGLTGDND